MREFAKFWPEMPVHEFGTGLFEDFTFTHGAHNFSAQPGGVIHGGGKHPGGGVVFPNLPEHYLQFTVVAGVEGEVVRGDIGKGQHPAVPPLVAFAGGL